MTENLYLGNVITKGATTTIDPLFMPLTDRAVTIRPSEPEAKDLKYYMDLIYYNRVNSLGDILTSLVYVGDFRTSSPDNTFTYVPENMFRHNNAEIYINVSDDDSDFSGYNYLLGHATLPLYSQPADYEVLSKSSKLSNTLGPIDIAFDGWYTLITVSVTDRGFSGSNGELTWITPNNYTPYQVINNGVDPVAVLDIKDFSNENIIMGALPYNSTIYNSYKRMDFFVLYDFRKLYKKELEREAELKYKAAYNSIIEKGGILELLLSSGDFISAQQLLQTVEDSVLLNVLV